MLVKLAGITLVLACLAGCCCDGGLEFKKPYDPFTNYNDPRSNGTPYSYDDYYQTRSRFLDQ